MPGPIGNRSTILFQVKSEERPSQEALARMKKGYRRFFANPRVMRINPHDSYRLPPEEINTRYKLVRFVHAHHGPGRYIIYFWNRWRKNKNYIKSFTCIGNKCPKWGSCRIKNLRLKIPGACWNNPRVKANWSRRCGFIVVDGKENEWGTDGFQFLWLKREDLMHYFKWFWRGKIKGEPDLSIRRDQLHITEEDPMLPQPKEEETTDAHR